MKHYLPLLVVAVLLLLSLNLSAQTPTIQDCLGAIPICEPIYHEDKVANGEGNYPNEIDNAISCLADERNAIWYTFTVNETGDFGFILTPNDSNDDYDWALYDLTNATCEEIRTNPDLLVSCNAAGQQNQDVTCVGPTGPTGGSTYNIQGAGCHNDPPTIRNGNTALNALVPVQKYNRYVLVVSNWSRSTAGYTIDFSVSAGIGIFDLEDPEVVEANFPEQCGDDKISIEFNENIQCATVNNFNFVLDGPGGPYEVAVLSPVCDQGGLYTPKFDLVVDPPITESGSFTLSLDGDRSTEVLDLCNNPAFNTSLSFEVEIEGAIEVDLGDDIAICPGNGVTLDATLDAQSSHFNATYLWSTGATTPTINVSQPGDYGVTVTLGCASGSDVVSLIVDGEDSGPYVNLGGDRTLCVGEKIELDATNFDADYSWSTGSSSPIITVREAGTYSVTVTDECGSTTQSVEIAYVDVPEVDLGADIELCPGESTTLELNIPDATYLWHDGSTASNITVKSSGTYAVSVTTLCGTITDEIEVTFPRPFPLDLGEDQQLCNEQSITLSAVDHTNIDVTYIWQDGSTNPTFEVTESGIYQVTVNNGCESVTDQIEITFGQGVSVDLGADQTLCAGETLELNVAAGNATYLWNDGSKTPNLIVSASGIYEVTVTSDCGEATDQIEVNYVEPLSLELGANQQLCDGQNVTLDATNTDVTYTWQDGSTNPTFEVTKSGTYEVTITNGCETLTDQIEITFGQGVSVDLGADQTLCAGETLELNVAAGNATYLWNDGSRTPNLIVSESGIYEVTVTSDCGEATDQIEVNYVEPLSLELGANQQLCDGQNVTLDVTNDNATYTWQDGSTNPTFEVTESGTYEVTITNGCETLTDQIEVTFGQGVSVDLGADQTLCAGETLELNVAAGNATYLWNDGSTTPNLIISESGIYEVTVTSDCGEATDQIEVNYVEPLSLELGANQQLCDGQNVTLDATNTDATYTWQDGSTNPTFEVTESGIYEVTITNGCETLTDQIEITFGQGVSVDLGADRELCVGEELELNIDIDNVTLRWQDGSTENTFTITQAGVYWLEAVTDCGTARDSIIVDFVEAPSIDLGEDQQLCAGDILELEISEDYAVRWQNGSTENTFTVSQSGTYSVELANQCGRAGDAITVNYTPDFELDLGTDQRICEGESLLLESGLEEVEFRWQDGSTEATFSTDQSGEYWLEVRNECFVHFDTVEVIVQTPPTVELGEGGLLCEGDVVTLDASSEDEVNYTWSDGSNEPTLEVTSDGIYQVTVSNECGRMDDFIRFTTPEPIEVELGQDTTLCEGATYTLLANTDLELEYRWQNGSGGNRFIVEEPGEYLVEVSNECETVIDVVNVVPCQVCDFYAPNVFSPNFDGRNERFSVFPSCQFLEYQLQVYDRWGTLIFQSEDREEGWTGLIGNRPAPQGVYVWKIKYMVEENYEMSKRVEVGEVTLLR